MKAPTGGEPTAYGERDAPVEEDAMALDSGMQGTAALTPAARRERIVPIDAMRGVALLGILLVNVQYFQGPERWDTAAGTAWQGGDRVLFLLVTWLVEAKFIAMFAFLFGLGIALQTDRARDRGRSSTGLLVRRLLVLAIFGALHALLLWSGDILLIYALLGLVLLAFRNRPVGVVRTWALALWGVITAFLLLFALVTASGDGGGVTASAGAADPVADLAASGVEAYRSGSYPQMVAQRARELAYSAASFPLTAPWVLALMLFGLATGRSGLIRDLTAHGPLLRRLATIGLVVGLPLALLGAAGVAADPDGETAAGLAGQLVVLAAAPVLAMGYLALGAQVFTRHVDAPLTRRLAATGRMAFTNYLLQSVLCTIVYYGLGLYGRGSLTAAFGVWALVSVLQVLWSPWWLARHEYGPMEWLWRLLTYGRRPVPSVR